MRWLRWKMLVPEVVGLLQYRALEISTLPYIRKHTVLTFFRFSAENCRFNSTTLFCECFHRWGTYGDIEAQARSSFWKVFRDHRSFLCLRGLGIPMLLVDNPWSKVEKLEDEALSPREPARAWIHSHNTVKIFGIWRLKDHRLLIFFFPPAFM